MIARTELTVEPRPTSIAEVLQATIADFSTTHRRPINVEIEPELPEALADATFLRQVVTNLVSNADKYSPADEPIDIVVTDEAGHIAVRVRDNGAGVDEVDLPQIFNSFYRSVSAVEKASGSGLGLTVCKRLIQSLGGDIWASNRPEGGLEVGFTLKKALKPEIATNGSRIAWSTIKRAKGTADASSDNGTVAEITHADNLAETAEPTS
jgi:signal transduction histidine kinase